jgi:hypothetical protein
VVTYGTNRRKGACLRSKWLVSLMSNCADALAAMPDSQDGQPPLPIQTEVPTLDELLGDD